MALFLTAWETRRSLDVLKAAAGGSETEPLLEVTQKSVSIIALITTVHISTFCRQNCISMQHLLVTMLHLCLL